MERIPLIWMTPASVPLWYWREAVGILWRGVISLPSGGLLFCSCRQEDGGFSRQRNGIEGAGLTGF